MNFPYDPVSQTILDAQRRTDHVARIMRETDHVDRMVRETTLLREANRMAAMSIQAEKLQIQESLAARAEAMRAADSQRLLSSFITIQQDLARDAMRTVDQHRQFVSLMNDTVLKQVEFARTMLGGFKERILVETALRDGLISSLVSAYQTIPSDLSPVTASCDELFDTVIRGFEETGLTHPEADHETVIWRFDRWLATFPPHVLNIVISLVIGILIQALSQQGSRPCKCETKALPEVHESYASPTAPEHTDASDFDMCQ